MNGKKITTYAIADMSSLIFVMQINQNGIKPDMTAISYVLAK